MSILDHQSSLLGNSVVHIKENVQNFGTMFKKFFKSTGTGVLLSKSQVYKISVDTIPKKELNYK